MRQAAEVSPQNTEPEDTVENSWGQRGVGAVMRLERMLWCLSSDAGVQDYKGVSEPRG